MLNKVIIHQQLFIIFLLFLLIFNHFANFINSYPSYLIWIALFFVSTLGVSHGALDGKLIWRGINKISQRIILFGLYLTLVILGWYLWISYPEIGLLVLLIMSVFHFGNSDLKSLKLIDLNTKLAWGFTMTFLPILFKRDIVESIFYNLIGMNIPDLFIEVIYCILIFSIIRIYWSVISSIVNSMSKVVWFKDKDVLLVLEFTFLIILSHFTHPFVWFAIYFCGLHGVRSLIDSNFNWSVDLKWLVVFTFPVAVFIGFTYGRYWNADVYSLIFPILGSLTIAHMSLPSLLRLIKR
jgi:Brp/Blh family beta-carotene 15,15'-monooxygenase